MMTDTHLRDLISRIARLDFAQGWAGNLNPTQFAILGYLGRANRFSRSPSHVADYLGTTRGTATQSLKSLQQKGYVIDCRSAIDKRVISYELTETGRDMTRITTPLQEALLTCAPGDQRVLRQFLQSLLLCVLAGNQGKEFGLCNSCRHHRKHDDGPYCALLDVKLTDEEADQICHEQVSA